MAATTIAAIGAIAAVGGAASDNSNSKKSIKSQEKQKLQSQQFIEKQMNQARGELFKLFPSVQDSNQKGLQAGLDLYSQSIPMQLNAFQKGNFGAQQQIARGAPQVQNAILGKPVDYSAFQPQAPQQVPAFNVQAPQFQGIQGLMGQQPQQPQLTPEQIAQIQALGIQ